MSRPLAAWWQSTSRQGGDATFRRSHRVVSSCKELKPVDEADKEEAFSWTPQAWIVYLG